MAQTYRNWELIIIDDGSADATRSVVQNFQSKNNRILYHFQTNKGLAKARNAGLRKVKGSLICFVDSDDELAPRHLENRASYLHRYPLVDFLYGGMKLIGPKKKHYVVDLTNPSKKIHLSKCHVGGTFFFRTKVLRRVKGFHDLAFGEDFDLYSRVAKSFTVRKVRFQTYLYHLDSENRLCDVFTEKLMQKKAVGS